MILSGTPHVASVLKLGRGGGYPKSLKNKSSNARQMGGGVNVNFPILFICSQKGNSFKFNSLYVKKLEQNKFAVSKRGVEVSGEGQPPAPLLELVIQFVCINHCHLGHLWYKRDNWGYKFYLILHVIDEFMYVIFRRNYCEYNFSHARTYKSYAYIYRFV